jgi:hypothetical protein
MNTQEEKTGFALIEEKASDIIQKNAEVEGTLKILDYYAEAVLETIPDEVLWIIRHAYRTVESAIQDAGEISDTAESMRQALKGGKTYEVA